MKDVVVYRLSALGDVAMTIPAVYSCAQAYPDTRLHVVTTRFCSQLFIHAPANVVLHPIDKSVGTWRILQTVSGIEADAVADLHNVLRSWLVDGWSLLRGKRVRMLDKRRGDRHRILHAKGVAKPYTQRYFDVFARLGLPCQPTFTSLFATLPPLPIDRQKGHCRWIGIAPFARYDNKRYPMEQMETVVGLLSQRPDTYVFLFGSRGTEAETLSRWASAYPHVTSVAGRFTLDKELQLMAHLDVMLTMDSSNMHLASLTATRVVSVWGSTTPACGFMGYGQQAADALCANRPCQPCTTAGSPQCRLGTLACMTMLPPEHIVEKLIKN